MSEFLRPMYPKCFPSLISDSANSTAAVEESGVPGVYQRSQRTLNRTYIGDYKSETVTASEYLTFLSSRVKPFNGHIK